MGRRLGVLIDQVGTTRERFAEDVGMSVRELYRYIAGRVQKLTNLDTLELFASGLGMTRDQLQRELEATD